MTDPIRVLVADDHPFFRDGVRALLDSVSDTQVVGEAATGDEAVELALAARPDVVLMDLQMPGLDGIGATRRIVRGAPETGVIVLTMFDDDDSVFAAMRAGARGYLLKGADQDELLRAVRAVAAGEALFSPAIARRLMGFFAALPRGPQIFPELTEREREVLELIAQGVGNQDIAQRLSLSPKTVRNHGSIIFSKLQVADRARAIVLAREAGLGRAQR